MEQNAQTADGTSKAARDAEPGGQLKIFFGYAAGVGKTYAMLKAAHAAKRMGADVVVGCAQSHGRAGTAALLKGLEAVPLRPAADGAGPGELDVEAAIARGPRLILVDDLAHANPQGSRSKKRYQDVEELLRAGIDVYTTVNVQNIESLNDMVASVTGVTETERIPDSVFDRADQVELVDVEPSQLIERLDEGQTQPAPGEELSPEKLTALREIAMRRCADRVNRMAEGAKTRSSGDYYTDEHILVCLSSSPTNARIIRTAARMAQAFRARFTALFVETSDYKRMSAENKARLRENTALAQRLGASVETTYGDDVALQISEYARIAGVSKIVLGRYNAVRGRLTARQTLTEKLIAYAPKLDIYIIPDQPVQDYRPQKTPRPKQVFSAADFFRSLGILAAATALGFVFYHLGFSEANIITVYILGVLLTSILTSARMYSIVSAMVSVVVFNFFFTVPRFTLNAYDPGYPATFLIMFLAALITGNLAMRIKEQARQSAQAAYRTRVMFDTNQALQEANGREEIISVTARQLVKLLKRSLLFYMKNGAALSEPIFFPYAGAGDGAQYRTQEELAAAARVYENNKRAGASTDTLSDSRCLYLAVRMESRVYGVVGVPMEQGALEPFENSVLLSILGECAMALENEQTAYEKEQAAILAKNEQLRANLLRAISHDLRTPLTSISGNAGVLLSSGDEISPDKKRQLYTDIYDDSMWLINLVENLLAVTRIGDGTMALRLRPELMGEVIGEALRHVNRKKLEHRITVAEADELALARMDAHLIVQVVINIVDNAIKYTPPGSDISIRTRAADGWLITEIADSGPGISDEAKPRIFDMFYTADTKLADSRRSMGLGLALCRSIISAHGGTISVEDNHPSGALFRFTLPVEEVTLHE